MKCNMKAKSGKISGRNLTAPKALLLDFGGVIVELSDVPGWPRQLAEKVRAHLDANGIPSDAPPVTSIENDIKAGFVADSHWKNAMSRPFAPRELTYDEFWGDFVCADWPEPVRSVVLAQAEEFCRLMGHLRSDRQVRTGLADLLATADAANVAVGIVSNALCSQVHLEFLEHHKLTDRFSVIVHSDIAGVRKPNPEMILIAARELGVDALDVWYVGDNYDRDVLCGARAGIGGNILMEADKTYDMPYDLDLRPDAIVADPAELNRLLSTALEERAA